jgi:hypothetical protein
MLSYSNSNKNIGDKTLTQKQYKTIDPHLQTANVVA